MKKLCAWLLMTVAGGALGQIYECRTPSGNIVQQSGVPCAPGMDTRNPAREAARRNEQEREAQKVRDARELEVAADRREVRIGMTPEQVVRAWGNPARNWVAETKSGKRDYWAWRCPNRRHGSNEVVFRQGVVSAVYMSC